MKAATRRIQAVRQPMKGVTAMRSMKVATPREQKMAATKAKKAMKKVKKQLALV